MLFMLAFALLAWAGPGPLAAEVQLQVSYEYVPVQYVEGLSVSEMIIKGRPLEDENGAHRYATGTARWRIRYPKVTFSRPLIDVCQVDEPGVTCTCLITLPQLQGGDEDSQAKFAAKVEETRTHELTHCNIALNHARKLEERFKKIGKKSCDKIGAALRDEYEKVVADCHRDQKEFDFNEYGRDQYLRIQTMQSMIDSGAAVQPPKEGQRLPKYIKRPKLNSLDQDKEKLSQGGIYKDENGVWRNY